jgi:hypothetical protein
MLLPRKKTLASLSEGQGPNIFFSCPPLHPNPRLWKYHWQIFTCDSPWEEDDFFENSIRLSTANFFSCIDQYSEIGVSCIVYNKRYPRLDPQSPWDLKNKKWDNVSFHSSWEDDTDPVWNGHK